MTKKFKDFTGKIKADGIDKASEEIKSILKDRSIMTGKVFSADRSEKGDFVSIYIGNQEYRIYQEEFGASNKVPALSLIDKDISFLPYDYDAEAKAVICSREAAVNHFFDKIVKKFERDKKAEKKSKVYKGKITSLVYFGAYVEIEGGVPGILTNQNFSQDHIAVGDVLSVGDEVEVTINKVKGHNIMFETPEKFKKVDSPIIDKLAEGRVVAATVQSKKDYGFFARIGVGIDMLVPYPQEEEIFLGSRILVRFKDMKTNEETGKCDLTGRFIRTISFAGK